MWAPPPARRRWPTYGHVSSLGRPPLAGQLIFRGIFGRLRAAAAFGRNWPRRRAAGPYRGRPPRQAGGTDSRRLPRPARRARKTDGFPAAGAAGRSPAGQGGVTVAPPVCH
jgi:hypothetical protein